MGASDPFHSRGFGSLPSRLDGGLPVAEDLHAVVLFADLAGFTTLGEALAASGPAGSESLHGLLNGYFAILIDHVVAAGGEVTTFAGDALAAVFAGCGRGPDGAAARALRCAVDMQDALTGAPAVQVPGNLVRPHMRVGLGAGPLTRALVGDQEARILHVLAGVALERAVAAQAHSQEGEVLADTPSSPRSRVWTSPRRAVPGASCGRARLARGRPAAGEPGGPTVAVQAGPARGEAPGALARRLLDEHRLVTSVFLALPDMGVPRDGAARLQDYLRVALPVIRATTASCARSTRATRGTSWSSASAPRAPRQMTPNAPSAAVWSWSGSPPRGAGPAWRPDRRSVPRWARPTAASTS